MNKNWVEYLYEIVIDDNVAVTVCNGDEWYCKSSDWLAKQCKEQFYHFNYTLFLGYSDIKHVFDYIEKGLKKKHACFADSKFEYRVVGYECVVPTGNKYYLNGGTPPKSVYVNLSDEGNYAGKWYLREEPESAFAELSDYLFDSLDDAKEAAEKYIDSGLDPAVFDSIATEPLEVNSPFDGEVLYNDKPTKMGEWTILSYVKDFDGSFKVKLDCTESGWTVKFIGDATLNSVPLEEHFEALVLDTYDTLEEVVLRVNDCYDKYLEESLPVPVVDLKDPEEKDPMVQLLERVTELEKTTFDLAQTLRTVKRIVGVE